MGLVERLMHIDPDPDNIDDTRSLSVHSFFAAAVEINAGEMTVAQLKIGLNTTAEDNVDLDALIATVTGAGNTANRLMALERIHSVFILAEDSTSAPIPGYDTPDNVRSKLGI